MSRMKIDELLADIDISNNGYIWRPTEAQYKCAKYFPDIVGIDRDCIKRVETIIERF